MSLRDQLARVKEKLNAALPPESVEVMHRVGEDLVASGIAERSVGVGDTAPNFTLQNQSGEQVSLSGALAQRPVILGFFRGRW